MKSVPGGFWQWVSTLNSDDITGITICFFLAVVTIIAIICTAIYKVHKTRADDALKRELLDRGLGAEEIATIINAKSSGKDWWRRHSSS
jgi:hypothetical protein